MSIKNDKTKKNSDLISVTIDGVTGEFPKGTAIISAAEKLGIKIPRYCYHEFLPIEGSCRLCLVEIEKNPKLQLSCATQISDGMVVHTDNPKVKKARKGVLEFLLLNHPLDCPICDKAGECELQDFYFEFSAEDSRLTHDKWKKKKKKIIGKNIILDQERCILCGRCVRFMDTVAKEPILGRFGRGEKTVLDCFPGESFDNVYSMNTVDICPVGALTSRDFRFKKRTWFLESTNSVCPHCSTGCTIKVEHHNDKVYRIVPETNVNINLCWMCDHGRLSYHKMEENLLENPAINDGETLKVSDFETVYNKINDQFLENRKKEKFLILTSYYLTNEESLLTYKLAENLKAPVIILEKEGGLLDIKESDEILISEDKVPNRIGVERVGLNFSKVRTVMGNMIEKFIKDNNYTRVILVGEDLTASLSVSNIKKIKEIPLKLAISTKNSDFVDLSDYILPSKHFFEKDGTFVNKDGILQKLNKCVDFNKKAKEDFLILAELLRLTGSKGNYNEISKVFDATSEKFPELKKINFKKIPVGGVKIL
jgi:NADH-quinone oxidoreductase subunit G